MTDSSEHFLDLAFTHAKEALENQEVPVGCIFVHEGKIVASGRNTVNETKNATRHAEFNCIDQVVDHAKQLGLNVKEVFSNVSVFVTVEPCIMCAAALFELDIKEIWFGCKNDRFGGSTVLNISEVMKPRTVVKGGYRAGEAMDLLKEFYKGTNPSAPLSKVKVKNKR